MLGEQQPSETAAAWGMIWKWCVDDELMAEAGKLAAKFAKGPTVGLGLIRQVMRQSWDASLDTQLEAERAAQTRAGRTRDFIEGVSAFLQKRPAKFTGQ